VTLPLRFAQPTAGFRLHEVPTFEHDLSNDTSDLDPRYDAQQVLRTAIESGSRSGPSCYAAVHPHAPLHLGLPRTGTYASPSGSRFGGFMLNVTSHRCYPAAVAGRFDIFATRKPRGRDMHTEFYPSTRPLARCGPQHPLIGELLNLGSTSLVLSIRTEALARSQRSRSSTSPGPAVDTTGESSPHSLTTTRPFRLGGSYRLQPARRPAHWP